MSLSDHSVSLSDHRVSLSDHSVSLSDHSVSLSDHSVSLSDHRGLLSKHQLAGSLSAPVDIEGGIRKTCNTLAEGGGKVFISSWASCFIK